MEVHTHSHTERKKWTHYLWEFLMLFLAVFCGFLAENFREHQVEHQRERQYIRSLVEDLQGDIGQAGELLTELHQFISRLDSITGNLDQSYNSIPSVNCLKQISLGFGFNDFVYTDRTMQQLKNAGGMRLIRNLPVADSIVAYDALVRRGLILQDLINTMYIPRVVDKVNYLINTTEMDKLSSNDYSVIDTSDIKKSILLSRDKSDLIRLINEIRHYRFVINIHLGRITSDGEMAKKLAAFLKKEYRLE